MSRAEIKISDMHLRRDRRRLSFQHRCEDNENKYVDFSKLFKVFKEEQQQRLTISETV